MIAPRQTAAGSGRPRSAASAGQLAQDRGRAATRMIRAKAAQTAAVAARAPKPLPGAHKPRNPAVPSSAAIIKAAAGDVAASLSRPRTATRADGLSGCSLLQTGHVHGEIVDGAILRELAAMSVHKDRVDRLNSVPPSPANMSFASEGTQQFAQGSVDSPASLAVLEQHGLGTPPTVKRGHFAKGPGSDGSTAPQSVASPVQDGDETQYSASPVPSGAPGNVSRYSSSTAAARNRLIADAKARQLFPAQATLHPGTSSEYDPCSPHTRPTGPGNWPDIQEQKATAAEKRAQYKQDLDLQLSAHKGPQPVPSASGMAQDFVADAVPRQDVVAVYHNEQAIMPLDSVSKRLAQERYKAELDQQLQEKCAQTSAAWHHQGNSKAAGVWVSKKVKAKAAPQLEGYVSESVTPSPLPSQRSAVSAMRLSPPMAAVPAGPMSSQQNTPELRATRAKVATMHWGEREVEAWHAREQQRLDYRAELLAQIAEKKAATMSQHAQPLGSHDLVGVTWATPAKEPEWHPQVLSAGPSPRDVDLSATSASPPHTQQYAETAEGEWSQLGGQTLSRSPAQLDAPPGSETHATMGDDKDCQLEGDLRMPHTEPGMTDFGLTREMESWERPKGGMVWSGQEAGWQGDDGDLTPRFAGQDEEMPAYVEAYLGGQQVGVAGDANDGLERADDETPRFDGETSLTCSATQSFESPSTQLTSDSRTRAKTYKIAFGRRVPAFNDRLPQRPTSSSAGSRSNPRSANVSMSSRRPGSAASSVPRLNMPRP